MTPMTGPARPYPFFIVAIVLATIAVLAAPPAAALTVRLAGGWDGLAAVAPSLAYGVCVETRVTRSASGLPMTVASFALERGWGELAAGDFVEVAVPGGELGGDSLVFPGMPAFTPGRWYFLPLGRVADGRFGPFLGAAGVLQEEADGVLATLAAAIDVTGAPGLERTVRFRRDAFLAGISARREGGIPFRPLAEPVSEDKVGDGGSIIAVAPPNCAFLVGGNGFKFRFASFAGGGSVTLSATTPGQTGLGDGGTGAVSGASAAWTNDVGSRISLVYGGTIPVGISCTASFDRQMGAVVFNDPCADIADLAGCNGTLGLGGISSSGTHTFDAETWNSGANLFVVINNGAQCAGVTDFAEMMTHETGHGLGFGHHNDSDATMFGTCCHAGRGAGLGNTDRVCAAYAYPEVAVAPADPSNLTAVSPCGVRVNLAWNDNSNNETGFTIERGTNAGGPFSVIGTVGANVTGFADISGAASTTYFYRVKATNGALSSNYTNSPGATTGVIFDGDLDMSGTVNATDLVTLANYLVSNVAQGTPPFTAPLTAADINDNGPVDATDLVLLANFLVGNVACI